MKIHGTVLLHQAICKMHIHQRGYIGSQSICVYKNGLYVNTSHCFLPSLMGEFTIPIQRISSKKDGFEIDFSNIAITIIPVFDQPLGVHGWIGPFKVKYEEYTDEKFYERMEPDALLQLCAQYLEYGDREKADLLKDIRRKTLYSFYQYFSLDQLKDTHDYLLFQERSVQEDIRMSREEEEDPEYIRDQEYIAQEIRYAIEMLTDLISHKKTEVSYEEMHIEELEELIPVMLKHEKYEDLAVVQQYINKKKSQ